MIQERRHRGGDSNERGLGEWHTGNESTSGAGNNSKRVATRLLAEGETSQHGQYEHKTIDVPELSTPPTNLNDPRQPTEQLTPPRI